MALENETTLKEFWSKYNMLQAIKNIAGGWQEVTPSCMSGIWMARSHAFLYEWNMDAKKSRLLV